MFVRQLTMEVDYESPLMTLNSARIESHVATLTLLIG